MKNYLDFEKNIKKLEENLKNLKHPFQNQGLSNIETEKISHTQIEIDQKLTEISQHLTP